MSTVHAANLGRSRQPRIARDGTALRERLGDYLRGLHPRDGAKHVQGRLAEVGQDIGLETCKSWWQGRAFPTAPHHLQSLAAAYGASLIEAVFGPEVMDNLAVAEAEAIRIQQEADAARARAEAIRQHRRTTLGL